MKDFIYKLYSNENFTLYLTIILVVLVILFFVILFFGKKDKKKEEEKRLKTNPSAFKEISDAQKIEVKEEEKDATVMVKPMGVPAFDDLVEEDYNKVMENGITTVLPVIKEKEKSEEPIKTEEKEEIPEPKEVEVKIFEPNKEEEKEDEELPDVKELHFDELGAELEKELNDLENIKNEFQSIDVNKLVDDDVKEKEVVKEEVKEKPVESKKAPQVFSSVFIDKDEDEDMDLDLPTLKNTPDAEKNKDKEDVKPFSFDDISGETYNINDKK